MPFQIYRPSSPIQWTWVTLAGPDARDFLHRLTTVNVNAMQPGQGSPGCFLTAQGKIRAYFMLWCLAPEQYAFELDAGADGKWKQALLSTIEQFTFAEKITVSADPELTSCWLFDPVELSEHEVHTQFLAQWNVRICNHGKSDFGRTWATVWGTQAALEDWEKGNLPNAQAVSFETLENWRIQAVRPRVDAEITEQTIPLEAGLKEAIAENKGCYPGQEVIEKIISLGAPPKRLARIDGTGNPPSPGEALINEATPPSEIGTVTSVAVQGTQFTALGFVKKIHAKEGLPVRFSNHPQTQASIARITTYE